MGWGSGKTSLKEKYATLRYQEAVKILWAFEDRNLTDLYTPSLWHNAWHKVAAWWMWAELKWNDVTDSVCTSVEVGAGGALLWDDAWGPTRTQILHRAEIQRGNRLQHTCESSFRGNATDKHNQLINVGFCLFVFLKWTLRILSLQHRMYHFKGQISKDWTAEA